MKHLARLLVLAILVTPAVSLFAHGNHEDKTYTGWISDEKCGAKNASAKGAACAQECVSKGAAPVFVSDAKQTVMKIDNPDAVKGHVGHHVSVTGTSEYGVLHVENVKMVGQ